MTKEVRTLKSQGGKAKREKENANLEKEKNCTPKSKAVMSRKGKEIMKEAKGKPPYKGEPHARKIDFDEQMMEDQTGPENDQTCGMSIGGGDTMGKKTAMVVDSC
ncbi:unnamed protein product [Linum trigynum]|uniref:Uncharacterized protein n=1 Tax=Linum trigynum TaxID=586398 RepID=A0AAV2FAD0_9ROSI